MELVLANKYGFFPGNYAIRETTVPFRNYRYRHPVHGIHKHLNHLPVGGKPDALKNAAPVDLKSQTGVRVTDNRRHLWQRIGFGTGKRNDTKRQKRKN